MGMENELRYRFWADPNKPERGFVRPSMRFVYVEHTDEQAPTIWKKVEDCDVILVEGISDMLSRVMMEQLIRAGRQQASSHEKSILSELLNKDGVPYDVYLMIKAVVENKDMRFIDLTEDNPVMKEVAAAMMLGAAADRVFRAGAPNAALEAFKGHIKVFAAANNKRETYVLRQLEVLQIVNSQAWSGKKIAVVQGAAHSLMYHRYKDMHPGQKVSKVMPKAEYGFTTQAQLLRLLNLHPDKPVDDVHYQRGLIDTNILIPLLQKLRFSEGDVLQRVYRISKMIPDSDIRTIWAQLTAAEVNFDHLNPYSYRDKLRYDSELETYKAALNSASGIFLKKILFEMKNPFGD